jgi:malonyl-CoA reductase/3-hydroxypropionate dehydrogenase (NADP+)
MKTPRYKPRAISNGQYAPNQLVRYDSEDKDNLPFAADWAATLTNRVRQMDPINLWIPKSIQRATGKASMPSPLMRVLPGLHKGQKRRSLRAAALGIGLQLGRYLAIAGCRVLLSARSAAKLEEARDEIVEELRGIGYPHPETRVTTMAISMSVTRPRWTRCTSVRWSCSAMWIS